MPENKRTANGVLGGIVGLVGLSAAAGVLVTAAVTPAIAVSGAAASSAISMFDNMPSYLEIDELMLPTTIWAGDRVLAQFYDQNRSPVTFDQVAPVMYDAILSSEDPRYYQHGGVDLIGTTRALLSNASGGQTQGGSSISQQYVKNVLVQRCERNARASEAVEATDTTEAKPAVTRDQALQACALEAIQAEGVEGYQRKLQEMRYAISLEKRYTKDEILLGYLNIANFGGTTYGIDAAAKYYFNVPASQLSIGQSATLAGMVQNPNTYRIDRENGSMFSADGTVSYNKAPDGSIDDVARGSVQALYTLLDNGEITEEQLLTAADGYSATKGRQLYVLSQMEETGKITHEEYVAAAVEPITPQITPANQGCAVSGAPYFCQYVVSTIMDDPAFGETEDDRQRALRQDGLNIYTTLDWRLQDAAQNAMSEYAPRAVDGMKFGSTAVNVESKSGRVLAIAQNTEFTNEVIPNDPGATSIVFAGDRNNGGSTGFNAGSTFKLFTLVDWLEQGRSVNEPVNGRDGPVPNMKNSCSGPWVNTNNTRIRNFNSQTGYVGTPLDFTRQSLNTGYLGMAAQLDLCDIAKVAKKMGVTRGNGTDIDMKNANNVIGDDAVSPLAMAGAYATVANGGWHCQPKVIDRVTDSKGAERAVPEKTCSPVISPEVAATAAFALQGVMTSGGTGSSANPFDGTPVLGKTGTHEAWNSWMIESSTNVTTAVWAGNYDGLEDIFTKRYNGRTLNNIRYPMARDIQLAADEFYGGDRFPQPDNNLTRRILRDVPNVVGQSIGDATSALERAGFEVAVGDQIDSEQGPDRVAAQSPSGQAAAGSTITLSPGNGLAATVPNVAGQSPQAAAAALESAGFANLSLGVCTADLNAPAEGQATGTNPPSGTATNRNQAISIDYTAKVCAP